MCKWHCPMQRVAEQFPQLCEAKARAFERVLGTRVQRLATLAHGDHVCTAHVPSERRAAPRATTLQTPRATSGKSRPMTEGTGE